MVGVYHLPLDVDGCRSKQPLSRSSKFLKFSRSSLGLSVAPAEGRRLLSQSAKLADDAREWFQHEELCRGGHRLGDSRARLCGRQDSHRFARVSHRPKAEDGASGRFTH